MTRRLADLDTIALPLMRSAALSLGISRNKANASRRARLQIGIREAMRGALPDDDPRRDPAWPFNEPANAPLPDPTPSPPTADPSFAREES